MSNWVMKTDVWMHCVTVPQWALPSLDMSVTCAGRDASHLTLECALQTHPQAALISEEVRAQGTSLAAIINQVSPLHHPSL